MMNFIDLPHIFLCSYLDLPGREGRHEEHEAGLSLLLTGLRELAGLEMNRRGLDERLILAEKGKPSLAFPDFSFNISHSHGLAICAFDKDAVGVDTEKVRHVRDSLARRVLSASELERFTVSGSLSDEYFMRLWTLKEAYGKQCGKGISYEMNQICFRLPDVFPQDGQGAAIPSPIPGLSFYQWKLEGGYILSLCCKSDCAPENIKLHFSR